MIKIGNLTLGEIPRIVVSVSDLETEEELKNSRFDVLEVRADLCKEISEVNVRQVVERGARVGIPVILTVRNDPAEGAVREISDQQKYDIFNSLISLVDAVDIEGRSPLLSQVVDLAREHQKTVIVSSHNFQETLPDVDLDAMVEKARQQGADIIKIAMHANTDEDLRRMAAIMMRHPDKKLVTISLGEIGSVSRLVFPLLGSLLTFSFLNKATAPGQIPLKQLQSDLRRYSVSYRQYWNDRFGVAE